MEAERFGEGTKTFLERNGRVLWRLPLVGKRKLMTVVRKVLTRTGLLMEAVTVRERFFETNEITGAGH